MIDWTKSMKQTFEHYIVDPNTWRDIKKLNTVISTTIDRDSDSGTLGSATIDAIDTLGECYVRTYLIATQNGETEKVPLGTHLLQTPSSNYDGKIRSVSIDAYTPLLELKEKPPALGYSVLKEANVMDIAYLLTQENLRAPVVRATNDTKLQQDFVANSSDTWLTFLIDLIANAKYKFALDELGRVLFAPQQDTASLQPVWTYTDDNSSILYPEIDVDHDIYGIPNVVEVLYSNNGVFYYSRVVNDDENSPLSTVNRGREIIQRVDNPNLSGIPTQLEIDEYAKTVLRNASSIEYTVSYTHGYCPVRLGDCVRLDYRDAGLKNVKAKVISQSIKCTAGCQVTEKAVFTKKLWEG